MVDEVEANHPCCAVGEHYRSSRITDKHNISSRSICKCCNYNNFRVRALQDLGDFYISQEDLFNLASVAKKIDTFNGDYSALLSVDRENAVHGASYIVRESVKKLDPLSVI